MRVNPTAAVGPAFALGDLCRCYGNSVIRSSAMRSSYNMKIKKYARILDMMTAP